MKIDKNDKTLSFLILLVDSYNNIVEMILYGKIIVTLKQVEEALVSHAIKRK